MVAASMSENRGVRTSGGVAGAAAAAGKAGAAEAAAEAEAAPGAGSAVVVVSEAARCCSSSSRECLLLACVRLGEKSCAVVDRLESFFFFFWKGEKGKRKKDVSKGEERRGRKKRRRRRESERREKSGGSRSKGLRQRLRPRNQVIRRASSAPSTLSCFLFRFARGKQNTCIQTSRRENSGLAEAESFKSLILKGWESATPVRLFLSRPGVETKEKSSSISRRACLPEALAAPLDIAPTVPRTQGRHTDAHSPGRSVSSQLGASADSGRRRRREGSVVAFSHRRGAQCSSACSACSASSPSSSASSPRQGARRGSSHHSETITEKPDQKKNTQERRGVSIECAFFLLFALLCVSAQRGKRKNEKSRLDSTCCCPPAPPPPPPP